MVAATVESNPNGVDTSYGHTDQKEYQNLMAQCAEGKISKRQVYSATVNAASLSDGAGETIQLTGCNGALLGKTAVTGVIASVDLVDMTVTAYVQADAVIELRIQNESGSATDLASGTWYVITETLNV